MSDLHDLTAVEQGAALRSGECTSVELTEHYLDRIGRHDALFGAFVTVLGDAAVQAARTADAALQASPVEDLPALCGLPLGVKDLHATAGVRTTSGSRALADVVPLEDGWTVGLLRAAGIVLLGKTSAPEFGPTCYTDNDVVGRPAVTPYDITRYASGSSGGSAAAVAAGLMPVGHASDGAGSTRTPAAVCHLVGVKPSRGLVSAAPNVAFMSTGTEGPLARTVADAALLLDVMADPPPAELYRWRPVGTFADAAQRDPARPLRVAMWTATGVAGAEPSLEAVRGVQRTARLLEDLGHRVEVVDLPAPCDEPMVDALTVWFASAIAAGVSRLVAPDRRALLRPYTQHLLQIGLKLTASDVVAAQATLAGYAGRFLTALDSVDVALTPTASGPAVPLGEFSAGGVEQELMRMLRWSCYTPWVNLSGQPAVSLPLHFGEDGLPYGSQLVGRRGEDLLLFELAGQLERASPWSNVHPPVWAD